MSLFGTSPPEESSSSPGNPAAAQRSKSSLFDDEPATTTVGGSRNSTASLFADDDTTSGASPWNATTQTKRQARRDLVKTLLSASDVPESYVDTYDLILNSGDRVGPAGIGLTSVRETLAGSGLSASEQAKILNIVVAGDGDGAGAGASNGLGRGEFNVLLALIGLAQEGEELSLDAVDDRRKKLPEPKSSYIDRLKSNSDAAPSQTREPPATPPSVSRTTTTQNPVSSRARRAREDSLGSALESDPWGSPQLHRGHKHAETDVLAPTLNGYGSVRSTVNAWSNKPGEDTTPVDAVSRGVNDHSRPDVPPSSGGSAPEWGDFNATPVGGFGTPEPPVLDGFGQPSDASGGVLNTPSRSLGGPRMRNSPVEEVVTVTLLPEKEGMFMFQHRNYEVKSARRGSTVVRRYSDFVWLLDCLHKRYPFRQLPLLPPKRVAVNGTHISADSTSFLEKRRRGLVRFVNALVRHPVLSQEQLVVMFMTVPTELSVWRKQATISVQDEFTGRVLPPDLEDSLPPDLPDVFDTVRSGVKRSAEIYINLCNLLERLAKRNEGLAADHLRFSLALQSLTEATKDTYAVDTNDVPLLNAGINATAKHLSASQTLLEDEAKAWSEGVLEDLKLQRDWLVSMRELFDRRDRLARDNIPQLEKRIESNERKLEDLRARPQGTVKPGEIEKVEDAIFKDKESIVQQHARGVFIKECVRDELIQFQRSQYLVGRLHQDWSQERVKYSELQADNWRTLSDEVEGMPTGD